MGNKNKYCTASFIASQPGHWVQKQATNKNPGKEGKKQDTDTDTPTQSHPWPLDADAMTAVLSTRLNL